MTYNEANQPLTESYSGGTLAGHSVNSTYNADLQRATVAIENGANTLPSATYAYDTAGRLQGVTDGNHSATFAYQANLPLVSLASAPSGWMRRLEFEYDHQGRRIRKTVTNLDTSTVTSDTKFGYDGWNLLAELNGTNNALIRSYVWGSDLSGSAQGAGGVGGLLAVNDVANGASFVAYDGNGNVTALTKASDGTTSASYEYGPFGELIRASGTMARLNPFRFSTKYRDEESDFLDYGYRFYNPGTGRWLSGDALEEDEMKEALSRECKRLNDPKNKMKCCIDKIDPKLFNALKNKCQALDDLTIKCRKDFRGGCAPRTLKDGRRFTPCAYNPAGTDEIVLCINFRMPPCPTTGCIMIHELTHSVTMRGRSKEEDKMELDKANDVQACMCKSRGTPH